MKAAGIGNLFYFHTIVKCRKQSTASFEQFRKTQFEGPLPFLASTVPFEGPCR